MTQGLLSWWQGQAYDGRSCGPGRQGHVMAQAQCEPKTYYEYFESECVLGICSHIIL